MPVNIMKIVRLSSSLTESIAARSMTILAYLLTDALRKEG